MGVPLHMLKRVTVVGSGSWATALVKLFSDSGVQANWWVRSSEQAAYINKEGHNPRYLSFAAINPQHVVATNEADRAFKGSELVLFALPSSYLEATLKQIKPAWLEGKMLAASIKGFVPGSGLTPSQFIRKQVKKAPDVLVLGGPCHAEEMAQQRSTYVTIAGRDRAWRKHLTQLLASGSVRTVASNDPVGIEYAAILKNIIGVATGIANGLHYGDNFQAVLVSNAMREAGIFLNAMSPQERDLFHSAYFGDLLVTAYSDFSRNRTLGKMVGRGIYVSKALQSMNMVAEGYHASREMAPLLKKTRLRMPVVKSVHRILHQHANPYHEYKLLEAQLS